MSLLEVSRFRLLDRCKPRKDYTPFLSYLKGGNLPPKEEVSSVPTPLYCSYLLECLVLNITVSKTVFERAFNEDPNIVSLSEVRDLIRSYYGYSTYQITYYLGKE